MNLHRPVRAIELSADARANIARIEEIWRDAANAMGSPDRFCSGLLAARMPCLRPVVHRFRTYAIAVTTRHSATWTR